MRSVLILLHDYPPISTTGTERVRKFAQYLPEFGYRPLILTTGRYGGLPDDASAGVWRASDLVHTLFAPLRKGTAGDQPQAEQVRIATFASQSLWGRLRDRLMIPDTKLGWLLPASRLGQRVITDQRPALLFSSSPPETTHLIAHRLHRSSGLPWVADLRDGWVFEPPNPGLRQGRWRQHWERRLESRVVAAATAVITATEPIMADLQNRYPATKAHLLTLSNGFDAQEFAGLRRRRQSYQQAAINGQQSTGMQADGHFLLTYTGALAASRQGYTAEPFLHALSLHLAAHPQTPLRVRMVGHFLPEEQARIASLPAAALIEVLPPVSRIAAHQHQLDADAALLITAPGQRSVATLKLFDYIGAGRPILALAGANAAAQIIAQYDLGIVVPPDDPAAIACGLETLMHRCQAGEEWPGFATAQAHFERRRLTAELARLFDQILAAQVRQP